MQSSSSPTHLNVYKPTFIINNSFESGQKVPKETHKISEILQKNLKQADAQIKSDSLIRQNQNINMKPENIILKRRKD